MSSKVKLTNANGNLAEVTLVNPDTNINKKKEVDISKLTTYVDTVADLASLTSSVGTVIVSDKDRGGIFNAIATTTANNGTIFDGSGCSWERQKGSIYNTTIKTHLDSYLGLVNELYSGDNGTRVYLMPKATVTEGTGGAIKIFGDPYHESQTDYRDWGMYFSADQNGDTGTNGVGVFWSNSKVLGSYGNNHPDLGFSFKDGQAVGGRFSYNGSSIGLTIGQDAPTYVHAVPSVKLECQGDFAMFNDKKIRWGGSDDVSDSSIKLNTSNEFEFTIRGVFTAKLDQYGRFTRGLVNVEIYSLPYASSLTPNIQNGGYQKVYTTGNPTVNSIINTIEGDEFKLKFTADSSNRTITFTSGYKTTSPSYVVTANKSTIFSFIRDGSTFVLTSLIENI